MTMDFRSEYRLKNNVRMTPLHATSSNIEGMDVTTLEELGGRSTVISKTYRRKVVVRGCPCESP